MPIRLAREAAPAPPPLPGLHARDSASSRGSPTTNDENAAKDAGRASAEASAFARLLGGLGREVSTGEAKVHAALESAKRGRDVGPAELLALQAGVYRYSETVDLASKLVDRATSGVKTV